MGGIYNLNCENEENIPKFYLFFCWGRMDFKFRSKITTSKHFHKLFRVVSYERMLFGVVFMRLGNGVDD